MSDLFQQAAVDQMQQLAPLAERMRPRTLAEIIGQNSLVGSGGSLVTQLAQGHVPNMILVGPPGSGKTTIARLVAAESGLALEELSAVSCGLADVRRVVSDARARLGSRGQQTVLFLDEIHRFNRGQQDALLPSVEAGFIRLVGATTENPYVSINQALLSRLVTYELSALTREDITEVLLRAASDSERGLASSKTTPLAITDDALELLLKHSGADARGALTLLESAAILSRANNTSNTDNAGNADSAGNAADTITVEHVRAASDRRNVMYDRAGDAHYDHASAYIKSMRASKPEDALLYLAQMLVGGEDPLFIARRLVIFAAEDVGPAKPMALLLATAALQTVQAVGMPECRIALAQATRYCAEAPKSRQAIDDIDRLMQKVRASGTGDVPLALTNRPGAKAARSGKS